MPQGTMPAKGARSLFTLSAKPWKVTHRDRHADGRDLARAKPDAGLSRTPAGGEPEAAEGVDQDLLEEAQVGVQVRVGAPG